jgi:bleomycin hydrolase
MENVTPISPALLAQLEAGYAARPQLAVLSNALSRTTLDDASFVPGGAAKLRMDFSVEVPTTKITNQKQSGRCWMFATLNVLRERIVSALNLEDFSFSACYLAFYDKLEKANNFLEAILHYAHQDLMDRETFTLMRNPIPDGGQWDMAVGLVRKYGVVPSWVMPETVHSSGTAQYLPILGRKLREDGLELRQLVAQGQDPNPRRQEMLQEIYNALCILYGQPPKTFDLEYTDKNKVYHADYSLTPLDFFHKYVGDDLDDYVNLINAPHLPLHKTYSQPFLGNAVENDVSWLNLTQEELEDVTLRQLQNGELVFFSCDCRPDRDRANGYWDPDSFQYGQVLGGMEFGMDRAQRLLSGESTMNHCMVFCGVNLDQTGTPNRWKIENSWGDESGQKGYFVGSEKWFRQNVYQVVVRRSLLNEELTALLPQQPTPMALWDPFA